MCRNRLLILEKPRGGHEIKKKRLQKPDAPDDPTPPDITQGIHSVKYASRRRVGLAHYYPKDALYVTVWGVVWLW